MTQEYFSVALSERTSLAIPLANVGKVIQIEFKSICTVPGISDFWYGAINFKGSLLWVLDSDRYFNIPHQRQNTNLNKLVSVMIRHHQQDNSKQVAIVTPKLEGIIAVESDQLKQLEQVTNNTTANLKNCSDRVVIEPDKHTYILNPASLLAQLHQQSALLSA